MKVTVTFKVEPTGAPSTDKSENRHLVTMSDGHSFQVGQHCAKGHVYEGRWFTSLNQWEGFPSMDDAIRRGLRHIAFEQARHRQNFERAKGDVRRMTVVITDEMMASRSHPHRLKWHDGSGRRRR